MQNRLFHTFVLLLSLISLGLSSDILTDYRNNGIDEIEKTMDIQLTKTEYWAKYLQSKNTQFGYIESYSNILTCNKEKSTLDVYMLDENSTYKLQKEYSAYTGKNKGDKFKEGDSRTPIGIYTLTEKISKLDDFCGPLAFVTSYPNSYDKYMGRDGHGIWIHGLPTNEQRDDFTKGCIAINNKSIKCLDKHIDIEKTLLIINKDDVNHNVSKETLSILLSNLYSWRYTWLYNNIDNYLDFYSTSFIRFDGMVYSDFVNYKQRIFKKFEKKRIIFKNINVIPYPNSNDMYKISFKELYKSTSFEFSGNKVLIVKLIDNRIKIITEQ